MIKLKTFEWDKLNDEEYQKAIDYNCEHSEDILENAIEDVKNKKKLSRILCKFGKHNYITFLIAPYSCVPYFCDRCGERKPVDLEMEEEYEG